ncbi:MAG: four helix bundle protein [Candidatus Muirbacterium halophilum]|nr:four helix bundle protein [Candidatus Muirbacterium halophilum]
MSKYNIVAEKSYAFAIRIVKLYKYLQEEKREHTLSKQILRSGTSIGANIEEAIGAQSDKDFLSKVSIAYKECRETEYWLRLLKDTEYLKESHFESIHPDCIELLKIISSIIISIKQKLGI